MKRTVKLICLITVAVISLAGLLTVILTGGFEPSAETDGKTVLIATAPYDLKEETVDRGVLHERLSSVISVPFTVGITRNYSHGYPDVIITSVEPIEASDEQIKTVLNEAYEELDIETVDRFAFKPSRTRAFYYLCVLVIFAVLFAAVMLFFAMTGRPFLDSLKWCAASAASLLTSMLVEKLVGCREGEMVLFFSLLSLSVSTAVSFNSSFTAAQNDGNKGASLTSPVIWYAVIVLLFSAAALAASFFTGDMAGMTGPLYVVMVSAAAIVPSLIVSVVTVLALSAEDRRSA